MTRHGLHPAHLVGGLAIWGMWFVTVYGGLSYACVWADTPEAITPFSWITVVLGLPTLLILVMLCLLARYCWCQPVRGRQGRFIRWVSTVAYVAAAVATLAVGLPLMVLPPCV